jgi:predicted N-acetyltransferase YhbS
VTATRPLDAECRIEVFDCGVPELNRWLQQHAWRAEQSRQCRTFVAESDGVVVGYYALAAHAVRAADLPQRWRRGAPRSVPAALLAKLAVDSRSQGHGLGSELVVDAIQRVLVAAEQVGTRVLVVDALDDDAAGFYARLGFTATSSPRRLLLKLSRALRA